MDDSTEGRDPQGGSSDVHPGGRSAQGPNPDPGGEEEPGGLVPPYDGRTTGADTPSLKERAESVERQLAETKTGSPGATASPADEQPVGADEVTDEEPGSAKGVGESTTRRGEDMGDDEGTEKGRHDAGTQGKSQRPVGVSDERDTTSVDPQSSQDGAPTTPSGDQGG